MIYCLTDPWGQKPGTSHWVQVEESAGLHSFLEALERSPFLVFSLPILSIKSPYLRKSQSVTFKKYIQFSSVQSLSHVQLFSTPSITAHQASLSITNSQSSLKLMSIELVMPSSHLILCLPLLLLPPIPPSITVFSNESTLCMRWPKYWSFSFSIIPSKGHPGLISFRMDWLDLLAKYSTW